MALVRLLAPLAVLAGSIWVFSYYYAHDPSFHEVLDENDTILRTHGYAFPVIYSIIALWTFVSMWRLAVNPDLWEVKKTAMVLTAIAFIAEGVWLVFLQSEPGFDSSKWRSLLSLFILLVIIGHILAAILLIKLAAAPWMKWPLSLHLGWLLVWLAMNVMIVVRQYEVNESDTGAWALLLIVLVTALASWGAVLLREPLIAIGAAWGVAAWAAYIGSHSSDPIRNAVFWSSITSAILLFSSSLVAAARWKMFRVHAV